MAKFVFELQEILDVRNFEQEQAQIELGKAIAVENEINQNLNNIAQQYTVLKQNMKGVTDFNLVFAQNNHIKLLEYQKEELLKKLAEAKLVSEEKRKILQECMKKTSALEKFRDQQLEEYKQELENEEKKNIEELSTIKSNSKRS
ncbi:MAG: flagellar export protein FliJ [Treponema sp.]|nr:flagellar export protein FliJ [Treponema sp.]